MFKDKVFSKVVNLKVDRNFDSTMCSENQGLVMARYDKQRSFSKISLSSCSIELVMESCFCSSAA